MPRALFVNDSKATNATAAAPALAAFNAVRWILGGQAKSDNLDECAPHFGHLIGGAAPRRTTVLRMWPDGFRDVVPFSNCLANVSRSRRRRSFPLVLSLSKGA